MSDAWTEEDEPFLVSIEGAYGCGDTTCKSCYRRRSPEEMAEFERDEQEIRQGDIVVCPTGMGCEIDISYVTGGEFGVVSATGVYSDGTTWYHVVWGDRELEDYWIHWDNEIELA